MKKLWITIIPLLLALAHQGQCQTFVFDFHTDNQGWSGDFADYPPADSEFYELEFRRAALPFPLDTTRYALMITGNNHSDDLFMFLKKKIGGLTPNKIYKLLIDIELASDAPTNAIGIGGPPGESVFIKAGATLMEPVKVDSGDFYRMNIDKSNQAAPGPDMDTIGHVGVSDTTTLFTLINRSNATHRFIISTDNEGAVWVCIGTDSGFEGATTLYYSRISLTFDNVTGMEDPVKQDDAILFPNPVTDQLIVKNRNGVIRKIELYNSDGQLTTEVRNSDRVPVRHLKPGTYTARVIYADQTAVTRRVIIR